LFSDGTFASLRQLQSTWGKLSIPLVNSHPGEVQPGQDVYQRIENVTMRETLVKLQYFARLLNLGDLSLLPRELGRVRRPRPSYVGSALWVISAER